MTKYRRWIQSTRVVQPGVHAVARRRHRRLRQRFKPLGRSHFRPCRVNVAKDQRPRCPRYTSTLLTSGPNRRVLGAYFAMSGVGRLSSSPRHRIERHERGDSAADLFQPGATDLRGRHRNQHNHFDRCYHHRGTRTRRRVHSRDLQNAELEAPGRNDDPRPGDRLRATTSATANACRRVRRESSRGPGGDRHQDGPRVQSATASDGQSQRSSHLPRRTGRTEASGGQVR